MDDVLKTSSGEGDEEKKSDENLSVACKPNVVRSSKFTEHKNAILLRSDRLALCVA